MSRLIIVKGKKMKTCLLPALLPALLLLSISSYVTADTYQIDPVHTQVLFTVSHQGFSNSNGAFVGPEGTFEFDENDFSKSSVDVTIQSNKVYMDNATWKMHLSSSNWFNINLFPEITFKSTKVVQTGDKTMDITGDLTLLGESRSVTLNATFNKAGEMMGKNIAGFSATTTIDRTDWGFDTYAPAIGAEVAIRLEVEGIKQ
jgi:polyisoprenoid-binding protein YceI